MFEKYLTDYEKELLVEMETPENWTCCGYTIRHNSGLNYWIRCYTPFVDFEPYQSISGEITPQFSCFIAKLLIWLKWKLVLQPTLKVKELRQQNETNKIIENSAIARIKAMRGK